jgi:hypothetical protein
VFACYWYKNNRELIAGIASAEEVEIITATE